MEFLTKCSKQLELVQCTNVQKSNGMIVVTLEGQPAEVQTAEKEMETNGLELEGYPSLAVEANSTETAAEEKTSSLMTILLVCGGVFAVLSGIFVIYEYCGQKVQNCQFFSTRQYEEDFEIKIDLENQASTPAVSPGWLSTNTRGSEGLYNTTGGTAGGLDEKRAPKVVE